jgi:hypothetical protein
MNLSLRNRRFIPGVHIDFKDPVARKVPWLDAKLFSESDTVQLRELVADYHGKRLTDEELLSGGYDTFTDVCEVPLEWWDVADETGNVRFQLWVYCVDSGALFTHGTGDVVGNICQGGFQSDDEELGAALEDAVDKVKREHPDSEVAAGGFSFVD